MTRLNPFTHDGACWAVGAYFEYGGQGYVGAPFGDYISCPTSHEITPAEINSFTFNDCMGNRCGGSSAIFPCFSVCGNTNDPSDLGCTDSPPVCFTQTVSVPT